MLISYRRQLHESRQMDLKRWVNEQMLSSHLVACFMTAPGDGSRGGMMIRWLLQFAKIAIADISSNQDHDDEYYLANDVIWYRINKQRQYAATTVWKKMDWLQFRASLTALDRNFHDIVKTRQGEYELVPVHDAVMPDYGLVGFEDAMLWLGHASDEPKARRLPGLFIVEVYEDSRGGCHERPVDGDSELVVSAGHSGTTYFRPVELSTRTPVTFAFSDDYNFPWMTLNADGELIVSPLSSASSGHVTMREITATDGEGRMATFMYSVEVR